MAKVRDINDQTKSSQSCWEAFKSWEIWKKVLLGVGIASILALIITLPIVLTNTETEVMPEVNMTTTIQSSTEFTTTALSKSTTTAGTSITTTWTKLSTKTTTSILITTSRKTTTPALPPTPPPDSTTTTTSRGTTTPPHPPTPPPDSTTTTTSRETTTPPHPPTPPPDSTTMTTAITTTKTPALPPTPPPDISGWGEWLEWSSCTVTCDIGQRSKIRLCADGNGGIGDEHDCPGEGRIIEKCSYEKCLSGQKLVNGITQDLRWNILLTDNLFLDRYAQSVTLNGKKINFDGAAEIGYGIWRLTRADYEKILAGKRSKAFARVQNSQINSDFFYNVDIGCGKIDGFNDSATLDEILALVDSEPCISAMALITLLFINGDFPVPIEFDAQENILYQITDQARDLLIAKKSDLSGRFLRIPRTDYDELGGNS